MHTHMHALTCCLHTNTDTHMHIHMYTLSHTCRHALTQLNRHSHTCAHTCTHPYTLSDMWHMHTYTPAHVHTCSHMQAHTHTHMCTAPFVTPMHTIAPTHSLRHLHCHPVLPDQVPVREVGTWNRAPCEVSGWASEPPAPLQPGPDPGPLPSSHSPDLAGGARDADQSVGRKRPSIRSASPAAPGPAVPSQALPWDWFLCTQYVLHSALNGITRGSEGSRLKHERETEKANRARDLLRSEREAETGAGEGAGARPGGPQRPGSGAGRAAGGPEARAPRIQRRGRREAAEEAH